MDNRINIIADPKGEEMVLHKQLQKEIEMYEIAEQKYLKRLEKKGFDMSNEKLLEEKLMEFQILYISQQIKIQQYVIDPFDIVYDEEEHGGNENDK